MLAITAILVLVFASFDTARTLTELTGHGLDAGLIGRLVALKTIIALDVLLPLAFYLAVMTGLAALHRSHQTVALRSIGVSPLRTGGGVLIAGIIIAAVVASVSLLARPWAYRQVYALEADQSRAIGIADLAPDQFTNRNGRVLYAGRQGDEPDELADVFIYRRDAERSKLVLAGRANALPSGGAQRGLRLSDTVSYDLDRYGSEDRIRTVREITWYNEPDAASSTTDRKAKSTATLMTAHRPEEVAERQWRLSRPVATILLTLAAVPLSAVRSHRRSNSRLGLALGLFVLYFVVGDMARSWVEQGYVPVVPGLWWPHALLALILAGIALVSRVYHR
jgi:lipopolysaccharide export system permease protein